MVGFVGQGTLQTGKAFYDAMFEERGWSRAAAWQQIGENWHSRFELPASGACDIQLAFETSDTMRGILTFAHATAGVER